MRENVDYRKRLGTVPLKQMFTEKVYRRPTLIMFALFIMRQCNGNMAVGFYLTSIFDEADTGLNPGLQSSLVSLMQV